MNSKELLKKISSGELDSTFNVLYGSSPDSISYQRKRYINAINKFTMHFSENNDINIFSAPGRTEIGGNHTDHQHGCVLAASVNIDTIAITAFHNKGTIKILSEGYSEDMIDLSDLSINQNEKGTSASMIRGIASKFTEKGVNIGGFDSYITSDVLSGSGLSSSAAFEVLIGNIIDRHYNNNNIGAIEIAKISQYAENVYFGKQSGLMDQMVSSVGGFVFIDFKSPEIPIIKTQKFDFEKHGYYLCITDTKGSHANLTPDYVAVPSEMKEIASYFGKNVLRDVSEEEFYSQLPEIRRKYNDRAILRASHFFSENKRAFDESKALSEGNLELFFSLVRESGESSANLLQNLYSCTNPSEQGIPLAIMMSKRILNNHGAVRVHGGGFAGTIQAFVPSEFSKKYSDEMNRIFGENSCHILSVRSVGGTEIII